MFKTISKSFFAASRKRQTSYLNIMKAKYDYTSQDFLNRIGYLASQYMSNQDIANHLGITVETFRKYASLNSEIGHTLAQARYNAKDILRDIDVPSPVLFKEIIDRCAKCHSFGMEYGLTKRKILVWAKKSPDIASIVKSSEYWATMPSHRKWI